MNAEFKGITFEGNLIDLSKVDRGKGKEIATERRLSLKQQIVLLKKSSKVPVKDKYYEERKPSPVKHLTPDEIRKEYAMTPYNTLAKNAIYFIRKEGPVSSAEIADYLNRSPKQISSLLSQLVVSQKDMTVEKKAKGKGYLYNLTSIRSVEELSDDYLKYMREGKKVNKVEEGGKLHPVKESDLAAESKEEKINTEDIIRGEAAKKVEEVIGWLKETGKELQVSVAVDVTVRFGWLK